MSSGSPSSVDFLLVEDDPFKRERLERELRAVVPTANVIVAASVQQAVRLLRDRTYDWIILDIALPSHESRPGGAQPISQLSGGVEVLLELSYESRSEKVIIVTQYPEIEFDGRLYPLSRFRHAMSSQANVAIEAVLYFDAKGTAWLDQLKEALS